MQILSIFHYVLGGLTALFGCFPIIHLGFGIAVVSGMLENGQEAPPPPFFGWIFIIVGLVVIILMWALAAVMIVAGRKLAQHTGHTFCLVIAGIECMLFPFGTVLGVFTIIVLLRPTVKQLFGVEEAYSPPPSAEEKSP